MKRTAILLILTLTYTHQLNEAAHTAEVPGWVHELRSVVAGTFHAEVTTSRVKLADSFEKGKYFTFCLKGNGSLGKTQDPFGAMERMFSAHNWRYIPRYQADGHGSSSFAYAKGSRLCNIYVNVDSACDDEETGHVPSEFSFEIYCRDE